MASIAFIIIFIVVIFIYVKIQDAKTSAAIGETKKYLADGNWTDAVFKDVAQEIRLYENSILAYLDLGSADGGDLERWPASMAAGGNPMPILDEINVRRIEALLNACASQNASDDAIRNESLEKMRISLLSKIRHQFFLVEQCHAQVLAGLQKLERAPIVDRRSTSTWQGDGAGQTNRHVLLRGGGERASVIELLRSNGINCLYHFTDLSNFDSIVKSGGLFSWAHCEANEIKIARPGGSALSRELDIRRGLQDYVRMGFSNDHPMLHAAKKDGRLANPIILEIDLRVVLLHSVLFSNRNATANDVEIGPELDDLKKVRFDLIRSGRWANDDEKGLLQAEVLVIHAVPGYLIRRDGRLLRNPTKGEAASILDLESATSSRG